MDKNNAMICVLLVKMFIHNCKLVEDLTTTTLNWNVKQKGSIGTLKGRSKNILPRNHLMTDSRNTEWTVFFLSSQNLVLRIINVLSTLMILMAIKFLTAMKLILEIVQYCQIQELLTTLLAHLPYRFYYWTFNLYPSIPATHDMHSISLLM